MTNNANDLLWNFFGIINCENVSLHISLNYYKSKRKAIHETLYIPVFCVHFGTVLCPG